MSETKTIRISSDTHRILCTLRSIYERHLEARLSMDAIIEIAASALRDHGQTFEIRPNSDIPSSAFIQIAADLRDRFNHEDGLFPTLMDYNNTVHEAVGFPGCESFRG